MEQHDLPYGIHERHRFDLFLPEKAACTSGVILFIHGGGWSDGDKSAHHADARYFCDLGYICAAMNYRFVTDQLTVFDELDDITSALTAIKQRCAEYGIPIDRLILSGGSAGAHLALMYAYTRRSESPLLPVAVCAYCPPVSCNKANFLLGISGQFEDWKYQILSKCCGVLLSKADFLQEPQQTALKNISPMEYVSESCVPTAVFHGRFDELVPLEHVQEFVRLLTATGIRNDFLIYEQSGHPLDNDPETALQAKQIIHRYALEYF